jgi:hypothetical protein
MGHSNDTRPRRTALTIARHRKTREITAGGKGTSPDVTAPLRGKEKMIKRDFLFTDLFLTLDEDLLLGHRHHLGDRG